MGAPRILHRFSNTPHNQPFQPPNMPKYVNFDEDRMAKAFAAAVSQKKPPNSAKIAREFGASYGLAGSVGQQDVGVSLYSTSTRSPISCASKAKD
jgi:hypothetical protein